jgi:hypothetical protein
MTDFLATPDLSLHTQTETIVANFESDFRAGRRSQLITFPDERWVSAAYGTLMKKLSQDQNFKLIECTPSRVDELLSNPKYEAIKPETSALTTALFAGWILDQDPTASLSAAFLEGDIEDFQQRILLKSLVPLNDTNWVFIMPDAEALIRRAHSQHFDLTYFPREITRGLASYQKVRCNTIWLSTRNWSESVEDFESLERELHIPHFSTSNGMLNDVQINPGSYENYL